jgi:hypothetical protein
MNSPHHVPSRRSAWVAIAFFVFGLGACVHGARQAEVSANGELTEQGRKIPRPTSGQPVYYVPVIMGWHESGALVAGEAPPKRADVIRLLGQALAKEGYVLQALRPNGNNTLPSLILTIEWGYLNPVITHEGAANLTTGDGGTMAVQGMRDDPTQRESTFMNQNEMVSLVAGSALHREASFSQVDWQKLTEAVAEDRYYIIVSAYDYAASLKGEQELLWRTRMSTPRQGVWMNDVIAPLVLAGAPLFGRQTDGPTWLSFSVREGTVTLAPLEIKGTLPTPSESPAAPAKKNPVPDHPAK